VQAHTTYTGRLQAWLGGLEFETLLSRLSATFINLPAGDVDKQIEHGLQLLGEFMRVDRGGMLQFNEAMVELRLTHLWTAEGIAPDDVVCRVVFNEQFPWLTRQTLGGEPVVISRLDDLPQEAAAEQRYCRRVGIQSFAMVPLTVGGKVKGSIIFDAVRHPRTWSGEFVQRLCLAGEIFANAIARHHTEQQLHATLVEVQQLKDRLYEENLYLHQEMLVHHQHHEIVGNSEGLKRVLSQAEQVATTNATVLLTGETGTGKELLARAIHRLSARHHRPMIKVNCAALPATLVESELFGREKGAYTGALNKQVGRFEVADGSTIFLDEIGELPLELQAKLLRVLQDGQFERLGSTTTLSVDVRVIAATNRDLAQAMREGHFREDLYYRLNVFPIAVPPLCERPDDIPLMVWAFIKEFAETMGKPIETISRATMQALQRYAWPGNVRELRNVLERAMILSHGPALRVELPQSEATACSPLHASLAEVERVHISKVLTSCGGRIRGSQGAAAILGLKPTTLESRMRKLGVRRGD
jgi:transcriptional regulator with GAF, ATPase, and Fis domain